MPATYLLKFKFKKIKTNECKIIEVKNIEKLNCKKGFIPFIRKKGIKYIVVGLYKIAKQKIAPDKIYLFLKNK